MKNLLHLFLLFSLIIFIDCSSAKKSFEKGDYETAIEQAVKKLRAKPYNEKAKSALIDGYWLYFNQLEQGIADLKRTDKAFKWEEIATNYQKLNRAYDLIQTCPACKEVVGYAENYPKEYTEACQKAAVERYAAGEVAMQEDTRVGAKRAYFHFEKTKYYDPNYQGVDQAMADARERATIRVVVTNASTLRGSSDQFFNRVYEEVLNSNRNLFVAFYEDNFADPHHQMDISLDYFRLNRPETFRSRETVKSDSIVIGTVEQDSVTMDILGVVTADLTTFQKKVDAEGRGTIKIMDLGTGETLSIKSYPDIEEWNSEWATYNGDKRALTKEQYALTDRSEPSIPSRQYFFDRVSRGIGGQLSNHIQQFYRDY